MLTHAAQSRACPKAGDVGSSGGGDQKGATINKLHSVTKRSWQEAEMCGHLVASEQSVQPGAVSLQPPVHWPTVPGSGAVARGSPQLISRGIFHHHRAAAMRQVRQGCLACEGVCTIQGCSTP